MKTLLPIPGFPGYHLSINGIPFRESEGKLVPIYVARVAKKYSAFSITKDGKKTSIYLPPLVMKLFKGETRDRSWYLHFKDGDFTNCSLSNMEWRKRKFLKTKPPFPVIIEDTRTGCEVEYPTLTMARIATGLSTATLRKMLEENYVPKSKYYLKVRKP
jgi:hypothetical protein